MTSKHATETRRPADAGPSPSEDGTMAAIIQRSYGGPEVLEYGRVARPEPGRRDVLLRVHAASVSRGTWHLTTGLPRLVRLVTGIRRPRRSVPAMDVCGTVEAVGAGVTALRVGDRVAGIAKGSLAEFAVAAEKNLAAAPTRIDSAHAAVLTESGTSALQALDAARVTEGSRVLVIGASGGVGSFAVKMAVARGAAVTAVCGDAKAAMVSLWGAHRVVDYRHIDITAEDAEYDAVLDIAGGAPLGRLRRILAPTGTIVFVGNEEGGAWTGGFGRPFRNRLRMIVRRQRYAVLIAKSDTASIARIVRMVDGGLVPHVHATYPLERAAEAMSALASGMVCGKVAITVGRP